MAKMYPTYLPQKILDEVWRRGEIDVFNALSKSSLPNEYVVFYNRNVRRGGVGRSTEQPIDFIVIHPEKGLLGIEVKGGKLRIGEHGDIEHYYPSDGTWNPIDPHEQVNDALNTLWRTARDDGANYYIPTDRAVFFPHVRRADLTQNGKYKLPDATYCQEEMELLHLYIPKMFSVASSGSAWTRDAFLDIRRRLDNLPQATRAYKPDKKKRSRKSKKPTIARESSPKEGIPASFAKTFIGSVVESAVEGDEAILKNWPRIPYLPPRQESYPVAYHGQGSVSSAVEEKKWRLSLREILLAVGTLVGAFVFFHYIFERVRI